MIKFLNFEDRIVEICLYLSEYGIYDLFKCSHEFRIFIAAVASTSGELAYARKLTREGNRDDGYSIQTLSAAFCNKFRNRIHIAIAKEIARIINTCRLPEQKVSRHCH